MAKDLYRYFRIEAGELLQQLAKAALDLEKSETAAEPVMRLLRLAHTLKGAARVVRLADIADLSHAMEESLSPYRDSKQAAPRAQVDQVLAAVDAMTRKLAELAAPAAAQAEPATAPAVVPDIAASGSSGAVRLARADIAEVDIVLEGLSEIGNELEALKRQGTELEKLRGLGRQLKLQSGLPQKRLAAIANDVLALADSIERNINGGAERAQRELGETRDAAQRLRLVPVTSIFNDLERTARDAAHQTGKQVVFEAQGGEVRIEGDVLDTVQSAMIQFVRNALAHGIEAPAQRHLAGKAPAGRVSISVRRQGHHAIFRCTDDGAGIDLGAVRKALAAKGKPPHELQALDAAGLIALLLEGGISTSATVNEIAGRGIGLDLARSAIQNLHGELLAQTDPGQGTSIELRVPLTLAGLQVLLVENKGQILALPLDTVQRTARLAPSDILSLPEGDTIVLDGAQIPLLSLQAAGKRHKADDLLRPITVVVTHNATGQFAVAVERLHGMEHVVLRPLPAMTPADPIVLGLYLDIEGNPRMVLDPEQFRVHMQNRSLQAAADAAGTVAQHPILIVDDSLTTRMLECSILESAGFTVEMAASAEEGLEMAERNTYALFLVDVDMPGIDGYEFVARTRRDPKLSGTPCILVTSRNAPEDLQRGRDCGASDYIVKGEFDQGSFLRRVGELVQP